MKRGVVIVFSCLTCLFPASNSKANALLAEFRSTVPNEPLLEGEAIEFRLLLQNVDDGSSVETDGIGTGIRVFIDGVLEPANSGELTSTSCFVDPSFPDDWACRNLSDTGEQQVADFQWASPVGGSVVGFRGLCQEFPVPSTGVRFCEVNGGPGFSPFAEIDVVVLEAQPVDSPPNTDSTDEYGSSVAIDGNTFLVGLPGSDQGGSGTGSVAVYEIVAGSPQFVQTLVIPAEFTSTGFGSSIGIAGDTVVVGSESPNTKLNKAPANAVAAAIFERLANGGFSFKQPLRPSGGSSTGAFGSSVSASEGMIVVGAPEDDEDETPDEGSGAVYVFRKPSRTGDFELMNKLKPTVRQPRSRFGHAVAARGSLIVAGSPRARPNGLDETGEAEVFEAIEQVIASRGRITGSASNAGAAFGSSVAIGRGQRIAVGSPNEEASLGNDAGSAYLFDATQGQPTQTRRIIPNSPRARGRFGERVAFNRRTIAVGAPSVSSGSATGAIYRFNAQNGEQISSRLASGGERSLGFALGASQEKTLVGAPSQASIGSVSLELDPGAVFQDGFGE